MCLNVNKRFHSLCCFSSVHVKTVETWYDFDLLCDSSLRCASLLYLFGVSPGAAVIQGNATQRNSAKLLDKDDILKISYFVRRASYPAYESPGPHREGSDMCTLGNRLYTRNNLSLEYRLYLATYAEFRTFAGLTPMSLV